ncbi:MAG: SDR family oxidoreductase [Gammaproteobacteria bacterium]|nr:SDR family oxidoreductase [Gammaproteobacteria bacterium]
MTGPVLIIGCGDIGARVAAGCVARGDSVSALARSAARIPALQAMGAAIVPGDLDDAASLTKLPTRHALLYYFAPPPEQGNTDPRIGRFLRAVTASALPHKIVYISTSGVYGDHQGGWVDEDTPPNPQTARAKARLDAETQLLVWGRMYAVPVVILRVGGIYGPGRLPVERLRQGGPVLRREEASFTNRIHADDLAQVCIAAAEHGAVGCIYNVCDGEHSTMTDYFNAVADWLGLARPPQITLAEAQHVLSAGMLSYLHESRRMDNRRMREELGVRLLYPTLEQGLMSCAGDTAPG